MNRSVHLILTTTPNSTFVLQKNKKRGEPIYAEPSKVSAATAAAAAASLKSEPDDAAFCFQEYEGVQFRNPLHNQKTAGNQLRNGSPELKRNSEQIRSVTKQPAPRDIPNNIYANTQLLSTDEDEEADVELRQAQQLATLGDANVAPRRKFHSKSFSLSENQILAGTNLFQHNREMWEKRSELQSQQCLTTPRILSRNRIAPDLVMDLPFQDTASNGVDGMHTAIDGGLTDDEDMRDASVDSIDQLTSAERFAAANQCTLKKNERFSGDASESRGDLLAAPVSASIEEQQTMSDGNAVDCQLDDVLRIDEHPNKEEMTPPHKSPIPTKNTQKFVTKFADLHLTGGCLTAASGVDPTMAHPASPSVTANGSNCAVATATSAGTAFSSFKPAVKVKPPLLKKPIVLQPGTPEMSRRHDE